VGGEEAGQHRKRPIGRGDVMVLFTSPTSAVLLGLAAIALFLPKILRATGRGKALSQLATDED
jgi:putative tricarboxylic transport membrane protein